MAGKNGDLMRPVVIERGVNDFAQGSAIVEFGGTKVLCTASVDAAVPPWMVGRGEGWITAEYAMMPCSTPTRRKREIGKQDGRSVEIQRLIGRSLRATTNMALLGEHTIRIDCDVLRADGGTRTAAISGASVALADALLWMHSHGKVEQIPMETMVGAVSVGIVDGAPVLDLCYKEDVAAEVDMNVVMTTAGRFVEIQGTAESGAFTGEQLDSMLELAKKGIEEIFETQRKVLGEQACSTLGAHTVGE